MSDTSVPGEQPPSPPGEQPPSPPGEQPPSPPGEQPPSPPGEQPLPVKSLDSITKEQVKETGQFREIPVRVLGREIFLWLLGLVIIELVLIATYAFWTYPRLDEVIKANAGSGTDVPQAWADARSEWVTSVKDLGQIFLLTPVFPLIGAVMGYMFGRQQPGDRG
jgi:hypothetical protein